MNGPAAFLACLVALSTTCHGFLPQTIIKSQGGASSILRESAAPSYLNLFDPSSMAESFGVLQHSPELFSGVSEAVNSASNLLSFTDQGQNLAGIFFQASLLPYLLFLYFLSFRANRIPDLANFGFQFILVFVVSTIPAGIISKVVYGTSLANVDSLHGGAELLLTLANICVVLGLKEAMTNPDPEPAAEQFDTTRKVSLGAFGIFAVFCALGPSVGVEAHSPFLLGVGDIPTTWAQSLPWVSHVDPVNSLSIPTWAIHWSSVFEYLFAMNLVWQYAETTGNEKWKGMTWGMLPLHASGICACTYHFFYNPSELQFLVTSQAGLTLLGNITLFIAAFRLAMSNGWGVSELNPFPQSSTNPKGLVADGIASMPLELSEAAVANKESTVVLGAKLAGITIAMSYLVKYGSLGIDLPFSPNAPVATALILGVPAITAYQYANLSKKSDEDSLFDFLPEMPFGGGDDDSKPSLSFQDVKKFGVAGTVAYVLTELAFWVVAFPVAATALYQSTGHWPDVINESADRTAVLAFIFAGANIARLMVPLRLGAALALAPWVDENIMNSEESA